MDVAPQDVITKDNVSVKVNAVVYFRVMDPTKAVIQVEDYLYATSQLAQTTLRSVCGQSELDELLSEREKINTQLQEILDLHTDAWGIKVSTVEVKHIDLPLGDAALHGGPGRGRKRAAGQDHRGRGRISGRREVWPRRPRLSPSIPRPCNCAIYRPCKRGGGREQFHHLVPAAH